MSMSLQKLLTKTQGVQNKLHRFLHPESDTSVRRLQFFWVACGGVGLLVLSYGLVTFLFSTNPLQSQEKSKIEPTMIESALSKVDVYDAWRHKIEDSLDKLVQRTEAVETLFQEGIKREEMSHPPQSEDSTVGAPPLEGSFVKDPLVDNASVDLPDQPTADSIEMADLKAKLSHLEMKLTEQRPHDVSSSFSSPQSTGPQNEGSLIQKTTLGLSEGPQDKIPKTVETTIPAGAFAKTVLLSGLDASSAMHASSDPRPMLLRIIDHGTLPRRFQSDLKDCHCTAGAFGDLSSERVYARLEKLTCIERKSGEIIETQVAGYIAGADGKAGIRGIVVSKDGQFLARSLMGGIFSGLSNVANPQNRQAQVNPFFAQGTGAKVAGPSIGETFTSGMAEGATSALDRLSQYYIDRAEQLQPVIQIAAGQVVDIVFTEGTFIGSQTREQSSDASNQKKQEKGE